MDPFVATILKQSGVILGAFMAAGLLVAFAYGLYQYSRLQHALTPNMVPPGLG